MNTENYHTNNSLSLAGRGVLVSSAGLGLGSAELRLGAVNGAEALAPERLLDLPAADGLSCWDAKGLLDKPRAFFLLFLGEHCRCDFNRMHEFSFTQYEEQIRTPLPGRSGRRIAIAAPRGAAKSTVHTLLFPIMDLVSGRERHQVIISGTLQQAKNRLASIARELRMNGAIHNAYFGGRAPVMKVNSRRIELGGCRIEAYSAGSEMRGIAHGEYRPTRIILDDVEQSRNAGRAEHRRKLLSWYDEVVENLGDGYTHITMVGTILHRDSLLSTLLERPGYRGELYKSVIAWDERPDLWRAWQRLFTDRLAPDAADRAEAFFVEHRDEMLSGTEVFWKGKEPYEKLQERLLVSGRTAFFKEKQNSPIKDGSQIFDTSTWCRFSAREGRIETVTEEKGEGIMENGGALVSGVGASRVGVVDVEGDGAGRMPALPRRARAFPAVGRPRSGNCASRVGAVGLSGAAHRRAGRPRSQESDSQDGLACKDLRYFGFLDPALGKSTSRDGDYAAIATVGLAPDNTLYVVHVWMEKASPMKQIEQVFALHKQYRYEKFGFESNGFQETLGKLFHAKQKELRRGQGCWPLPVGQYDSRHNKHSRIALLEPHIVAGSIVFAEDLPEAFFVQADEYNGNRSKHDDGLDALAGCVAMVREITKPVQQIKRIGVRRIVAF